MDHTEIAMATGWDLRLVALSYVVAAFASYTALDLAGKVFSSVGRASKAWLAGGAFVMGTGIWSMHFIGMLAFVMPMTVRYDLTHTLQLRRKSETSPLRGPRSCWGGWRKSLGASTRYSRRR